MNSTCLSGVIFHEKIYMWISHAFLVRIFTWKNSHEFHVVFWCVVSRENNHMNATCFFGEDFHVKKITTIQCVFLVCYFTWIRVRVFLRYNTWKNRVHQIYPRKTREIWCLRPLGSTWVGLQKGSLQWENVFLIT